MKTNELKKGDRVLLRNGWYATIADNKRGNTRMATVEGFCKETGSIYAHDIMRYVDPQGELWFVEHTAEQKKVRAMVERLF